LKTGQGLYDVQICTKDGASKPHTLTTLVDWLQHSDHVIWLYAPKLAIRCIKSALAVGTTLEHPSARKFLLLRLLDDLTHSGQVCLLSLSLSMT
jgi:hypothetical protein